MSQPQLSSEERLKAARKRFEELKRKNKLPFARASAISGTSSSSQSKSLEPSAGTSLSEQEKHNNEPGENLDSSLEISELKETVEEQKSQIKKLRDENTELKLERMELNDKVGELEAKIRDLRAQVGSGGYKVAAMAESTDQSPAVPLSRRENDVDRASSEERHVTQVLPVAPATPATPAKTGDFREALLAWKGWQVDMRTWKGCQGAQVAL